MFEGTIAKNDKDQQQQKKNENDDDDGDDDNDERNMYRSWLQGTKAKFRNT